MAFHSAFGPTSSGSEVANTFKDSIRDKTVLITGVGPNGLGRAVALDLAAHSPSLLILAGRSRDKLEAVQKEIASHYSQTHTRLLDIDVASLASVRKAAQEINSSSSSTIEILINNAGVMNIPKRTLSADGFEMHFAVNYLGAFLFTTLIMPKLLSSGNGRIVNVASSGHALSPFRFSDYNFAGVKSLPESEQPIKAACEMFGVPWGLDYLPPIAYGQSKTASILWTKQLAEKLGNRATVICLNPGVVDTNLWREMPKEAVQHVFAAMPPKTPEQGAAPILVAVLDPNLKGKQIRINQLVETFFC